MKRIILIVLFVSSMAVSSKAQTKTETKFMQITTMQMTTKHAWQLMHTSKPGEAMTCNIGISTLVTSHGHAMVRLQTLKKGEAVSIRPCAFTLANF